MPGGLVLLITEHELHGDQPVTDHLTQHPPGFTVHRQITHHRERVYQPDPERAAAYDRLYEEYRLLHDYFGRGANEVMHRLRRIRAEASA